jgi:hypothetical protein
VPAAPRRSLNPLLLRRVDRSGKTKKNIAFVAGFPNYPEFYETLRAERVPATPLTVTRLQRVADIVGLPHDEIFLDEAAR